MLIDIISLFKRVQSKITEHPTDHTTHIVIFVKGVCSSLAGVQAQGYVIQLVTLQNWKGGGGRF